MTTSAPLRVLSFTTVFPSSKRPVFGLFVWERLRHTAGHVQLAVVAPVAWQFGRVSSHVRDKVQIAHPMFFYVPGVFKVLDGFWLALSALPCMARMVKTARPHVLDAHFGYPDGVAAACLAWYFGIPFVVTLRGYEAVSATFRLRRLVMAWALRRASAVIAVSAPLADLARSLGVQPDRVHVIENGVDLERFTVADSARRKHELGRDPTRQLLVSIGHLVPLKGFHRVIAALPRLLDQADVEYVIIGGPAPGAEAYAESLRALVRELRLEDRVWFAGPQPPAAVVSWLQAADVLVLDSDREGCPNVVLEAIACGTPVVAAAVGAVPDILDASAGLVYPSSDRETGLPAALRQALATRWDRATVRRAIGNRSWHAVASRVVAVWRRGVVMADDQGGPRAEEPREGDPPRRAESPAAPNM